MHIHHIALWTTRLEELKDFYITYFKGTGNEKYINPLKGFESYLVSFDEKSALIEIMRKTDVTSPADNIPHIGLAHFSFSTGSKDAVLALTERLRRDGFTVANEPLTTGDGFFESAILDPDGNLVEITV